MGNLHNRLFAAYEAATQEGLTEKAAAAYLHDLAALLQHWSNAMDSALLGDRSNTYFALKDARRAAELADDRKEFTKPPRGPTDPIVRSGHLRE